MSLLSPNRLICSSAFGFDEGGRLQEQLHFAPDGLVVMSVDIQSMEHVHQRTCDVLQHSVQLATKIATRSPCPPMSPHDPPVPSCVLPAGDQDQH